MENAFIPIFIQAAKNKGMDQIAADAEAEFARLRAEIARRDNKIREAHDVIEACRELAAFAQHHPNCTNQWSRSCECGYRDAYKKVEAIYTAYKTSEEA
jgi:hypothetical protein